MIQGITTSVDATDLSVIEKLRAALQCDIRMVAGDDQHPAPVTDAIMQSPAGSIIRVLGDGLCQVVLRLPDGGTAVWELSAAAAPASLRHAETILQLHHSTVQCDQLQTEIEALTTQVVHDFEELSLIRSLALAMELPSGGGEVTEVVLRALCPLATGINAISIAAVWLEADEKLAKPYWTGAAVVDDATLYSMVQRHRDEAEYQPVVRNHVHLGDDGWPAVLQEFILLQCRSEGRLHGWLVACNRDADAVEEVPWAQHGFSTIQASLLETATNQLAAQLHNMRLLRQKEELFTDVVRALVNAVEARDPYTCGHSERVARFAKCLAAAIGESSSACQRIYLTGLLHDVGKIAIPDGVLQKPGKLDADERAIIETHTDAGWRILHELEALRDVLPGVLHHHEHFDGNGYPDGLAGQQIPLDGRILAVCDAFDAMTSNRPYRAGMPVAKAVEILRSGSGKFWDPRLIDVFIEQIDAIDQIRVQHRPRQHAVRRSPLGTRPSPVAEQRARAAVRSLIEPEVPTS